MSFSFHNIVRPHMFLREDMLWCASQARQKGFSYRSRRVILTGDLGRTAGTVETHIIWGRTNACNGKLLWYYIWNVCVDWETATFNSNVTWDWWRQESVAMCSHKLDQRLLRWRDRMRSGDGRRCSVFVSVCLSQDGRNNHMLYLPQYVYLRIDPVTHSWVLLFVVCFERDVVYAWMFEP